MRRRADFRPFSWLHDLWVRQQLDLDPPYQRRSVWSEKFKLDFITTVLLDYPCPPIFLYEEIRRDGSFLYRVVDGKQRLTTLFSFVKNDFAVSEDHPIMHLRGRKFEEFGDADALVVWRYIFGIEFIEQENETIINDIFNRINKNVAKLSHQELRHAMYSGVFMREAETLADYLDNVLPPRFPYIMSQSKRQMKDVENTAIMILFIEFGERSVSQSHLDQIFGEREEEWESQEDVANQFRSAVDFVANVLRSDEQNIIVGSRLRNQADFYSLFAAAVELRREGDLPQAELVAERLREWVDLLMRAPLAPMGDDDGKDIRDLRYLEAARSASNDPGPRRVRIDRLKEVIRGR